MGRKEGEISGALIEPHLVLAETRGNARSKARLQILPYDSGRNAEAG